MADRSTEFNIMVLNVSSGLWQGHYYQRGTQVQKTELFATPHEALAVAAGKLGLVRGNPQLSMPFRAEDQSLRFRYVLDDMLILHDRKGKDYGTKDDIYHNQREAAKFGVLPWVYALMRLSEKISRVTSLLKAGDQPVNESFEESLLDIPVLGAIAVVLWREDNQPQ